MKRRTLLKTAAGALAAPLYTTPILSGNSGPRTKFQRKGAIKKLLVFFQRGGNDGLNTLVPIDNTQHNHYMNLRPTVGLPAASLLNVPGSTFFAHHPGMNALRPMMQNGHVSFIHCVGYPSPNRSHFESQSFYETATPGISSGAGWLNRFLQQTTGAGLIRGVVIDNNLPQIAAGQEPVPVSTNFGNANIDVDPALDNADSTLYLSKIEQIMNEAATPGNATVYDTSKKVFDMINAFNDRNLNNYVPENGAVYPNNGIGRRVQHAAQMLKDDPSFLGIEVAVVNQGGYDTHANQVPAVNPLTTNSGHGARLRELSESLAAFYTDMGPARMQDCLVLMISEFGRRAFQNDSLGTDHGTGAVVMVMNTLASGQAHNGDGDWPGLGNAALLQGRDLDWVTDFRDIYWEVLATHMGVAPATIGNIIPGHTYSPVGFL